MTQLLVTTTLMLKKMMAVAFLNRDAMNGVKEMH